MVVIKNLLTLWQPKRTNFVDEKDKYPAMKSVHSVTMEFEPACSPLPWSKFCITVVNVMVPDKSDAQLYDAFSRDLCHLMTAHDCQFQLAVLALDGEKWFPLTSPENTESLQKTVTETTSSVATSTWTEWISQWWSSKKDAPVMTESAEETETPVPAVESISLDSVSKTYRLLEIQIQKMGPSMQSFYPGKFHTSVVVVYEEPGQYSLFIQQQLATVKELCPQAPVFPITRVDASSTHLEAPYRPFSEALISHMQCLV